MRGFTLRVVRTIAPSARSRDGVGNHVLDQELDERRTYPGWKGMIDGRRPESFELLVTRPDGRVVERIIAYRPFRSVNIFRHKMLAGLRDVLPPDMSDDADSRGLADYQHLCLCTGARFTRKEPR